MSDALILVGGFGFIGRNILEALEQKNEFSAFTPVVVDDLSNACPGHERLGVAAHIGSYSEKEAAGFLSRYASTRRTFVFLAGETRVAESKDRPLDFIAANISEPARFVTEVVEEGDHFILVSTAGALFDGTFEITAKSPYCPKNFYGATKAAEEMILEKLVKMRGGDFSVVRLTNVYGRHSDRKKSAIHAFTRAVLADEAVTLNGDGKQTRDFVFSGDVGRGIATLANRKRLGQPTEPVNMIGGGASFSLMDVIETIESVTGKKLRYERANAKDLLATEPRDVLASRDDVRALLGDHITPFREGVRQTYEYYAATL